MPLIAPHVRPRLAIAPFFIAITRHLAYTRFTQELGFGFFFLTIRYDLELHTFICWNDRLLATVSSDTVSYLVLFQTALGSMTDTVMSLIGVPTALTLKTAKVRRPMLAPVPQRVGHHSYICLCQCQSVVAPCCLLFVCIQTSALRMLPAAVNLRQVLCGCCQLLST